MFCRGDMHFEFFLCRGLLLWDYVCSIWKTMKNLHFEKKHLLYCNVVNSGVR